MIDTETTGFTAADRVVEIGCVEVVGREPKCNPAG